MSYTVSGLNYIAKNNPNNLLDFDYLHYLYFNNLPYGKDLHDLHDYIMTNKTT